MVDKILGAHPVNDDFWDNTNPTDVSIDTGNSEKKDGGRPYYQIPHIQRRVTCYIVSLIKPKESRLQ